MNLLPSSWYLYKTINGNAPAAGGFAGYFGGDLPERKGSTRTKRAPNTTGTSAVYASQTQNATIIFIAADRRPAQGTAAQESCRPKWLEWAVKSPGNGFLLCQLYPVRAESVAAEWLPAARDAHIANVRIIFLKKFISDLRNSIYRISTNPV